MQPIYDVLGLIVSIGLVAMFVLLVLAAILLFVYLIINRRKWL